jgi:hypothetical protein
MKRMEGANEGETSGALECGRLTRQFNPNSAIGNDTKQAPRRVMMRSWKEFGLNPYGYYH